MGFFYKLHFTACFSEIKLTTFKDRICIENLFSNGKYCFLTNNSKENYNFKNKFKHYQIIFHIKESFKICN